MEKGAGETKAERNKMKRWEIINELILKFDLKSYLEIGLSNGTCFRKVACPMKASIDPDLSLLPTADYVMTSEQYFEMEVPQTDLVFIDGLHHKEQVWDDIESAILLSRAKFIVLHDCNPQSEEIQRVPRETKEWTGDVWKAWVRWVDSNIGYCIDTDYGVGIIPCVNLRLIEFYDWSDLTYLDLEEEREKLLNLKSVDWFLKWLS